MNLVIGFGNPLRRDDGLGAVVANEVGHRLDVAVLAPQQLLPEHTDIVRRALSVVFVDASIGVEPPGSVTCTAIEPAEYPAYGHVIAPADLLCLTRMAFGWVPKAWLITVAGASFEFGTQLSPAVLAAVPKVIERVETILTQPVAPDWSAPMRCAGHTI